MKYSIFIILIIFLSGCLSKPNDQEGLEKSNHSDTLSQESDIQNIVFEHFLKSLKEKKLDSIGSLDKKLRFYFTGDWFSAGQFYQVNFKDSILIKKRFQCVNPVGGKLDSIISIDTFKLKSEELKTLNNLIEVSMIWSLEQNEDIRSGSIDCFEYIYECIRPKEKMLSKVKTYCLVERYCPSNRGFKNLGEFLKYKTGEINSYKAE